MSKALVEILGDAASYLRSLRRSSDGTGRFETDLKKLAVTAQTTARAQIKATVNKDARLRQEIKTYREVAAAAKHGSREQVAAANLASQAERRLSGSLAVTAREARHLSRSAHVAERDIEKMTRGAIVGSGAFHRLGRSALFASSYILGGYGIVAGAKAATKASIDEKATMGQLTQAVNDAGLGYKAHRAQIEAVLASQRKLGFSQDDSIANLANEVRATRSISDARKALSLADNISRGRHVALSAAANAVARAYGGQTGALRRLLPFINKGATATEALDQANKAYAGSANKYALSEAGTQARLGVALHHTSVIIGDELRPEITRLSGKLSDWLNKSENQKRVQKDVRIAVHDVARAARILFKILQDGVAVVERVDDVTGSFENTVKLLAAAFVAVKFVRIVSGLAEVAGQAGRGARNTGTLLGKLAKLQKVGPINIPFTIGGLGIAAALADITAILAAKGAQGPGPPSDPHLGERPKQEFPLLRAIGSSFHADLRLQHGIHEEYARYRAGKVTAAQIEAYLRAHFRELKSTGVDVTFADLERSKTFATTTTHPNPAAMPSKRRKPSPAKADTKTKRLQDDATAANQLALAQARTDAQKLAALVDERRIIAGKMETIRDELKTASGQSRVLLLNDLTALTKKDTEAFNAIARIHKHEASLAAAAKRKAAAAARAAARDYVHGIQETATELLAAAARAKGTDAVRRTYGAVVAFYKRESHDTHLSALERAKYAKRAVDEQNRMTKADVQGTAAELLAAAAGAKGPSAVRRTYGAVVAFYKRESHDMHLTRIERARYAKLAIDEQHRMVSEISRERKAATKALMTKQLASLGVGAGQSISELLQRVKDAATAKQEGLPAIGVGPPTVRALKTEADQVAKALKGTYLDTNVSRGVIGRIRNLLNGEMGRLNATMRNRIQQLLQGLRSDMKGFDGFNLTAADKRRRFLDRRFADHYGAPPTATPTRSVALHRRVPTVPRTHPLRLSQGAVSKQTIHYHFEPHLQVIANEPIGHALNRSFFRQRLAMGMH